VELEAPGVSPVSPSSGFPLALQHPEIQAADHGSSAYSSLPEAVEAQPKTESELDALRSRRVALETQRQRILQLQQIEHEQSLIDHRISRLRHEEAS
jgi:hypothetical protein